MEIGKEYKCVNGKRWFTENKIYNLKHDVKLKNNFFIDDYGDKRTVGIGILEKCFELVTDKEPIEHHDKTKPDYYKVNFKQPIEMMKPIWGVNKFVGFCEMNPFKYRMRMGSKEGQDLQLELVKANRYEEMAKELRGSHEVVSPADLYNKSKDMSLHDFVSWYKAVIVDI